MSDAKFKKLRQIYLDLFKNVKQPKTRKKIFDELYEIQRSDIKNSRIKHKKIFAVFCALTTVCCVGSTQPNK